MSGPFGSSQWMYSSGGFYPYEIEQSLRFNDNDSANLSRTPAASSNRKTWTWSGWIKIANLSVSSPTLFASYSAGRYSGFIFTPAPNRQLRFYDLTAPSSFNANIYWSPLLRDNSAWYHIQLTFNSTEATNTDRVKLYINGVQQSVSSATWPSLNLDSVFNLTQAHFIGNLSPVSSNFFDGYMAEVNFIDGSALDPTSFGEFKSDIWVPKAYTGSYGTNGFYLPFADSGNIGDDTSGNTNDWTANNLAATDVLPDSPTNNFAVMNPLWKSSNTVLEEGNLYLPSRSYYSNAVGTMGVSSGKWYFEARVGNNVGSYYTIGVIATDDNTFINKVTGNLTGNVTWSQFATIYSNGTSVSNPTSPNLGSTTATKIVGCALDLDNNKVYFHGNGTWVDSSDPDTNTGGTTIAAAIQGKTFVPLIGTNNVSGSPNTQVNFGQDGTFIGTETAQGNTDENGYGNFYYPVPSGFLSMCSANLSAGAIDPALDDVPADYFNTVLYTGTGAAQSITGVGFQPDFVWAKNRSIVSSHGIYDVIRGTTATLSSHSTSAEFTRSGLTSFDADGFSVGSDADMNNSGNGIVAWNWKAAGAGVANTDGTITSTVSVNQKAGFSIVGYTGTGANATVGHGLGAAPKMIIFKNRTDAENWPVYTSEFGYQYDIFLDLTNAIRLLDIYYQGDPTSTTFSLKNQNRVNGSGDEHIAYCFAEVEGFSKFGSYTGNGSTDGPFVYCGFRPAFVMVKRTDTTGDWVLKDAERPAYNTVNLTLIANSSNAEAVNSLQIDFTANGFKWRDNGGNGNASGGTYIFMAFAEAPFKYSNAR